MLALQHLLYDVTTVTPEGRARWRKISKACKNYGVRVQFSVFECSLGDKEWLLLKSRLLSVKSLEKDSLRFAMLCAADTEKIEHHGVREPIDPDGPLVV